jgi:dephospho-CoA kinase
MLICVTGEINSGKTTALTIIKKQGYHTFSMDEYIHRIYKINKIGYQLIKKNFGDKYVNSREVDREKLGKLVFSNKQALNQLNKLMIPIMLDKIQEISEKFDVLFIELGIYIYHESLFYHFFDKVIFINAKNLIRNQKFKEKKAFLKNFPTINVGKLYSHSKD